VGGDTLFGLENSNSFANFLLPMYGMGEPHVLEHSTERLIAAATIMMGLAGFTLAWFFYMNRTDLPGRIAAAAGWLHRLLRENYYVDVIYDLLIVRPLVVLSDRLLYRVIDSKVIDDFTVNGAARTVRAGASSVLKYAQTGLAQSYMFFMIAGAVAVVGYLLT
jgi:NADH-quinone oxidoreductase subunit L